MVLENELEEDGGGQEEGAGAGRGEASEAPSTGPPPSLSETVTNRDPEPPVKSDPTAVEETSEFDTASERMARGLGPVKGEPLALTLWRGGTGAGRGEVSEAPSAGPPPSLSRTITTCDPGFLERVEHALIEERGRSRTPPRNRKNFLYL